MERSCSAHLKGCIGKSLLRLHLLETGLERDVGRSGGSGSLMISRRVPRSEVGYQPGPPKMPFYETNTLSLNLASILHLTCFRIKCGKGQHFTTLRTFFHGNDKRSEGIPLLSSNISISNAMYSVAYAQAPTLHQPFISISPFGSSTPAGAFFWSSVFGSSGPDAVFALLSTFGSFAADELFFFFFFGIGTVPMMAAAV